ncbi:MAG: hypothetical protein J0I19_13570 [Alphaproteobacteria bacterium]|nr:hypothetical protein [Alphaproteobacteria bacterium]
MKFPLVVLLLGLAVTGARAQSRDNGPTTPVIASPFQALGNVIRNPDADPPRNYPRRASPTTAPVPPPTIIPPGTLANPEANSQAVPQTPPR